MRKPTVGTTAAFALTLALAACGVGPDFVRPALPQGDTFLHAPPPDAAAAADPRFWQGFGDPQLAQLVEEALVANHDLRIALARLDRAEALLRGARFDRMPTVTASGSAAQTRASADQSPGIAREDRDVDSYSVGADASWELDLFGRLRRGIEARQAEVLADAADLRATQVAIAGEVAATYLHLRGLQEHWRVATDNATNQRETLGVVEARLDAGRGTGFDTARARAQLEATLARVPALEARIAFDMHRLAVLVGLPPTTLVEQLQPARALPALPEFVDPGTPGEVLRRRPDIAAAEARLHAATARIGVAAADLFPRFSLGALLGSQALDAGALFGRDSETGFVALGVDWSFLDGGRVRARIAAADADAEGELARYQATVLRALEETENALVRYDRTRREDRHLGRAAADSAEAARLARVRYDAGAADLLDVLDAERTRLQAQDAFADVRTRSATAAVSLYMALAGGWTQVVPERQALAGDVRR